MVWARLALRVLDRGAGAGGLGLALTGSPKAVASWACGANWAMRERRWLGQRALVLVGYCGQVF
jgi:hypothetical protein